jgi:hypothetical protein
MLKGWKDVEILAWAAVSFVTLALLVRFFFCL